MIATLTLNPALDHTLAVDSLHLGEIHRASDSRLDPGGKGINVSRVLHQLGEEPVTLALLAGPTGEMLLDLLEPLGIEVEVIEAPGETRINVAVTEPGGRQTKVNPRGPVVDQRILKGVVSVVESVTPNVDYVVMSGSLPAGAPVDTYARLIEIAHNNEAPVLFDADGAALTAGVEAKPFLVKPNRDELEELVGRTLDTDSDVIAASRELIDRGVAQVLVSLGAGGALLVTGAGAWRAEAPRVDVQNHVGLGDSLLAGFVYQLNRGASPGECLRWAVAAGSAAAAAPPVLLADREGIERLLAQVTIHSL